MRLAATVVSFFALAAIAISAALVLDKDNPPALAVSLEGVPGYVYYDRPYDVTILYTNNGGDTAEAVDLAASLPPGFTLQDGLDGIAVQGQRVVWHIGDLGPGESGEVRLTISGSLPSDLAGAVYDLPEYEGHTAFVEGFRLAVELTSDSGRAGTFVISDTGETPQETPTEPPPPPTERPHIPDPATTTPTPTPTQTPEPTPTETPSEDVAAIQPPTTGDGGIADR